MIRKNTRVLVTHDLGTEQGVVAAVVREVVPGEGQRFFVRFDDGTYSAWGESSVTEITTDKASYRYADLNGAVYCAKHVGCEAEGWLRQDPEITEFSTGLTSGYRMTTEEIADLSALTGGEVCESCRGGWGR